MFSKSHVELLIARAKFGLKIDLSGEFDDGIMDVWYVDRKTIDLFDMVGSFTQVGEKTYLVYESKLIELIEVEDTFKIEINK